MPRPCAAPLPAAVLHWGSKQTGRGGDWLQPPLKLLTPTTTLPMGGKSAETPFLSCAGGWVGVGMAGCGHGWMS